MKVLNKWLSVLVIFILTGHTVLAVVPQGKRTIYTSGEKVFPVHYQLGQSTIIYFGVKPEVVICGNKNYFNIEKLKDGITIQPLSNFSTNLSVMSGNKRYLFYLTPSVRGENADSFIDVHWVNPSQVKFNAADAGKTEIVEDLNQKIELSANVTLWMKRRIRFVENDKNILDLELEVRKGLLNTRELNISLFASKELIKNQMLVWSKDQAKEHEKVSGRLIFSNSISGKNKNAFIQVGFHNQVINLGLFNGKRK